MPFKHPKPLPPFSESDIARFWSKVDKTPGQGPNGECWGWTAGKFSFGYGCFGVSVEGRRRELEAHRVAYFFHKGEDPYPDLVLHGCDWGPCCRGEHIRKGSVLDNVTDRVIRGRSNSSVLSLADIDEIKRLYAEGTLTTRELGKRFNISHTTARCIGSGQRYRHLQNTAT